MKYFIKNIKRSQFLYLPFSLTMSLTLMWPLSVTFAEGHQARHDQHAQWVLIDDFEKENTINTWIKKDTKNDTKPRVDNPQVTQVQKETNTKNHYLMKKPAAEGIVGNRKALTFKVLPHSVAVGETYTFYSRVNIEYFPNNHVFGLSNLGPENIAAHDYNAFEPSLRITDKKESSGLKNDGTLMVKTTKGYAKIQNFEKNRVANPALTNTWYETWLVVNNAKKENGGQTYDVYIRGGEFKTQQLVYKKATFRMKRELPLIYFLMNCNTGPADKPYGNGGIRYDDLYMAKGTLLSSPLNN